MNAVAPALRVLIVEDSPRDAELIVRELRAGGREIAWERVESATTLHEALTRGPWDVILSDYSMPGFDALGTLAVLQASGQDIPCIVVSGTIGEETAVAAMRTGARDYLMKSKLARLGVAVDREIREARGRADAAAGATAAREKLDRSRTLLDAFAGSLDALIATEVGSGDGWFERSLQFAVDSTRTIVGARYAALGVLATAGRELASFVHSGIDPETVLRIGALPTGKGLLGVVIEHGTALRLDDLHADPRAEGFPPHHPPMRTLLAVPVGRPPDVLGRLYFADRIDGSAFTAEDERIAVSFSTLIATALRHLQLIADIDGSRKQFEGLFRRSPVATVIRRIADAQILDANAAYCDLVGYSLEELVGSHPSDSNVVTLEQLTQIFETLESDSVKVLEAEIHTRTGGARIVHASVQRLEVDGQPAVIFSDVDVTDQRVAEARQYHDARHDRLTGLLNRSAFSDVVEHAIAEAKCADMSFALMHLDIDRFADINAGFGYASGDELLRLLGSRLAEIIGEKATLSRPGGDEFLVLLPDVGDFAAATLAGERLLHGALQPFSLAGLPLQIDVSVGAALYPDHGTSAEELLRHAETAMTIATTSGVGFSLYSHAEDPQRPELVSMTGELRTAIAEHQLRLAYQPKVKIGTAEIVGVEALVRWEHPTRGLVPPLEFVPLAERTGLIGPLTLWVLGEALRQCGRWRTAGYPVPVAVNVSMRNLRDPLFLDTVDRLLRSSGVPASALKLEITESSIMADPERTHDTLRRLHDRGIGLSIDDFGTGFSSLAYLDRLPVQEIKVDRSFVHDVTTHVGHAAIVSAVVQLSRIFGLVVVAEGVEDEATADHLRELGCEIIQGYLFSRAVAPAEISAALDARRWCVSSTSSGTHARSTDDRPVDGRDTLERRSA